MGLILKYVNKTKEEAVRWRLYRNTGRWEARGRCKESMSADLEGLSRCAAAVSPQTIRASNAGFLPGPFQKPKISQKQTRPALVWQRKPLFVLSVCNQKFISFGQSDVNLEPIELFQDAILLVWDTIHNIIFFRSSLNLRLTKSNC